MKNEKGEGKKRNGGGGGDEGKIEKKKGKGARDCGKDYGSEQLRKPLN